jgi:ADP-heptose:LPS heptosyltransferase
MNKSLYIQGYYGFGDCIYQFPFVKELSKQYSKIYLRTPFPQLFDSIPNVEFIKPPATHLSTCKKYMEKYDTKFKTIKEVSPDDSLSFHYQRPHKMGIGMAEAFNNLVPSLDKYPIDWSIPIKPEWIKEAKHIVHSINTDKKICIIKLPSIRKEWYNIARVGKPDYFQYLIDKYKDEYYFISVGNKKVETFLQDTFGIDLCLDNGELSINGIVALTAMSHLVIGYHSFLIALGIATGTKTFCIFGGYIPPELWIDKKRMDMSKISYVAPNPFCECFNRHHKDCNKEIPLEIIDKEFEKLIKEEKKDSKIKEIIINSMPKKDNILISRIRAERCAMLADNKWISNKFNLFTVDHTALGTYTDFGNKFMESFRFPHPGSHLLNTYNDEQKEHIYNFCKDILLNKEIKLVINSHPLHTYNTQMKRACKDTGVKCINTEMFCDNKMIFDWNGCQYTGGNEIYEYANKIPKITDRTIIDYPKSTRQPQPDVITREAFFKKYQLSSSGIYIVLLGQLMWDMSVIQSVNKESPTYKDYVSLILRENPHITFLVKPHPIDLKRGNSDFINICKSFPNVVFVNESLDSLFDIFDYFTSFSSTTIFEGLMRKKKFATMGFHFCNNDKLVYQIRVDSKAKHLDDRLRNLTIDEDILKRYIYFVCNYYTVRGNTDKLFYRLTMDSNEYFSLTL